MDLRVDGIPAGIHTVGNGPGDTLVLEPLPTDDKRGPAFVLDMRSAV